MSTTTAADFLLYARDLTEATHRGRTILMALYLCVLALCFITPIAYYCRMRCEDRYDDHLRALEMAGIASALQASAQDTEQSRADKRKYMEEKKARIRQLMTPVRATLKENQFVRIDEEKGEGETKCTEIDDEKPQIDDDEDESLHVRIPVAGIRQPSAVAQTRLVPALCSICLTNYENGSDIVWSSNSGCEHVFHTSCIETWMLKQREGPLCPCCRRDFLVDPFDSDTDDDGHSAMWLNGSTSVDEIDIEAGTGPQAN